MADQPPALPGTLSRPDAQRIIDALNLRLHEAETEIGTLESTAATSGEKLKIIRGTVNTTEPGTIVAGSGFSIARNAKGTVTTTFTAAFTAVPSVTFAGAAAGLVVSLTEEVTASKAKFVAYASTTGSATDGIVHFIAIGPR